MQNHYLDMMQTTQKLIERANDISSTAEKVTSLLRLHKQEFSAMEQLMDGRSEAIRATLLHDQEVYKERFAMIQKELDEAIAALEGKPEAPPAEPPAPPESPPLEPPAATPAPAIFEEDNPNGYR